MRYITLLICLCIFQQVQASPSKLYFPIAKEDVQNNTQTELASEAIIDIVADEVSYDQERTFYEASGNAETYLSSRKAKLFADYISYDTEAKILEATGNVKMIQATDASILEELRYDDELPAGTDAIYGNYISFNVGTSEYKLEEPRLYANGIKMLARELKSKYHTKQEGKKSKNILNFNKGTIALNEPISVYSHASRVRTLYGFKQRRQGRRRQVDWDDVSDKKTVRYTAEEVYYDNTRKTNNLKIKGARLWIGEHLSIPSPVHITTTVGAAGNTKFKGPIIGTRERIGGFAMGPRFFYETEPGIFSIVPLVQIGNGPEVSFGAIGSFNTPGDSTSVMAGYGQLEERFILNAHQNIWRKYLQVDALVNQFKRNSVFGSSQVGQLYDVSSDFRLKLPFMDDRGMRIRSAAGWASDNNDLFSEERRDQLAEERGTGGLGKEHSGYRVEFETDFYTKPVWRYGNEKYNFSVRGRSQAALRFYDTGDSLQVARFGPAFETRFDNLKFELAYLFAAIGGSSPFLFDQFVDGFQAVILDGDYEVNKWFTIGTLLTYSLDKERFTRNQIRSEFGPEDFKMRVSYDTIRNQIGLGFNVIFGDTIDFERLKVKI
ncbi:MAG: hypothetical protein HOA17_06550 [Candidatus Melainabacteria bacterium]|nr:hypothetical protein [Candidatus Melainabacteria bacterium]